MTQELEAGTTLSHYRIVSKGARAVLEKRSYHKSHVLTESQSRNPGQYVTREGAQDFGDIVAVHYSFTRVDTYPDGRVELILG